MSGRIGSCRFAWLVCRGHFKILRCGPMRESKGWRFQRSMFLCRVLRCLWTSCLMHPVS